MKLRTLFWGSDEISVPFLRVLYNLNSVEILKVITQPAKPKGRGLKLCTTPVYEEAEKYGLDLVCPENIKDKTFVEYIKNLYAQVSIVVSYGKIFPVEIISSHQIGMLNIHFSILPKYRGAAPIQWALINGDASTGVSLFWINERLDEGEIFLQKEVPIEICDDYFTLSKKLVEKGCEMLISGIEKIINGEVVKLKQTGVSSTAPVIKKTLGTIDWNKTNVQIHNLVRALIHWPKAETKIELCGKILSLKILKTRIVCGEDKVLPQIGTIVGIDKEKVTVVCGGKTLLDIFSYACLLKARSPQCESEISPPKNNLNIPESIGLPIYL